jgi:hypothetical protein
MAKTQWTVMVYMGADNVPGREKDLGDDARGDILEMQAVGSDRDLAIVVQIDDRVVRAPQRFYVEKDHLKKFNVPGGEHSTGDKEVLRDFLKWARATYPARRYLLVIWGHAYWYAFDRDGTAGGNALDFNKLSEVIQEFEGHIDVLGFDACGVSAIEIAYELRSCVEYFVASEVAVPLLGWPYENILGRLKNHPTMTAAALSKAIVHEYLVFYKTRAVIMAALHLGSQNAPWEAFGALATQLAIALADPAERSLIAASFMLAQIPGIDPSVDLRQLCDNLEFGSQHPKVRSSARKLLDLLDPENGFIVAVERRGNGIGTMGGVSAYAPRAVSPAVRLTIETQYRALALAQETMWPEVVDFVNLATR